MAAQVVTQLHLLTEAEEEEQLALGFLQLEVEVILVALVALEDPTQLLVGHPLRMQVAVVAVVLLLVAPLEAAVAMVAVLEFLDLLVQQTKAVEAVVLDCQEPQVVLVAQVS